MMIWGESEKEKVIEIEGEREKVREREINWESKKEDDKQIQKISFVIKIKRLNEWSDQKKKMNQNFSFH